MTKASFTYYGHNGLKYIGLSKDRLVTFQKLSDGQYSVQIEGMPALTFTHRSYDRVKEAFEGFYGMAFKDWGASEIDWGDKELPNRS